jgi:hypothetical protein
VVRPAVAYPWTSWSPTCRRRVADSSTDAVHTAVEGHAGDGAAGAGQRRDGAPDAGLQVEGEAFAVRPAILLDETADGVEHAVEHDDADMVGALGQRRRLDPSVALGL